MPITISWRQCSATLKNKTVVWFKIDPAAPRPAGFFYAIPPHFCILRNRIIRHEELFSQPLVRPRSLIHVLLTVCPAKNRYGPLYGGRRPSAGNQSWNGHLVPGRKCLRCDHGLCLHALRGRTYHEWPWRPIANHLPQSIRRNRRDRCHYTGTGLL